jgi:hypothetical protein
MQKKSVRQERQQRVDGEHAAGLHDVDVSEDLVHSFCKREQAGEEHDVEAG